MTSRNPVTPEQAMQRTAAVRARNGNDAVLSLTLSVLRELDAGTRTTVTIEQVDARAILGLLDQQHAEIVRLTADVKDARTRATTLEQYRTTVKRMRTAQEMAGKLAAQLAAFASEGDEG